MNYFQAQNILDEVREGATYSKATVRYALELTGDLEPVYEPIRAFSKVSKICGLEGIRMAQSQRT
jgi:hypothetical protein